MNHDAQGFLHSPEWADGPAVKEIRDTIVPIIRQHLRKFIYDAIKHLIMAPINDKLKANKCAAYSVRDCFKNRRAWKRAIMEAKNK